MDDFEKEDSRGQHNHSSGLFIGRNNYGDIRYEMLDQRTKAILEKLSMDAPPLANLLKQALNEGVIPPDDIEALWLAGMNITEDVAEMLWLAGKNINKDVADNISQAADTLSQAADRFDYVLSSLNKTVEKLNGGSYLGHMAGVAGTITDAAERIERMVTPPAPEIIVSRKGIFKAFVWGIAITVVAVVLLNIYHVKLF